LLILRHGKNLNEKNLLKERKKMPYKDKEEARAAARRRTKERSMGRAPMRHNSSRHVALMYIKMCREGVTTEELRAFSPVMFSTATITKRATDKLVSDGLVKSKRGKFSITREGYDLVYRMPSLGKRKPEVAD
jgi:hypothetical protein